jgi:hypothetical protein
MALGINFLPGNGEQDDPRGGGGSVGRPNPSLQQAVRLLNLRLPTTNQGGIAPNALLQSPGGSPDMNSAMSMQSLQRLFMALAGMGSPQGAGGYSGGGLAPQIGIGQALPPGAVGPGISPPGPGNLPPSPIGPGISPPGPGNLPTRVARSHGGPNDPMAEFLRTNGKVGRGISPPGPGNLPPPKVGRGISPPGPGNLPPGGPAQPRTVVSHGPGSGARPSLPRLPKIRTVSM